MEKPDFFWEASNHFLTHPLTEAQYLDAHVDDLPMTEGYEYWFHKDVLKLIRGVAEHMEKLYNM